MRRKYFIAMAVIATLLIGGFAAVYSVDGVRWRATVLQHKMAGRLSDISWPLLVEMLKPGSDFHLRGLADTPNLYAAIRNPYTADEDIESGRKYYENKCMHCHGTVGASGVGPELFSGPLSVGDSDWALFRTLTHGIEGTAMAASGLSQAENWRVVGYLLHERHRGASDSIGEARINSSVQVPPERIVRADAEPHNWLTYSGSYGGQRHSKLQKINLETIDRINLAWVLQTNVTDKIEASPIVVDGIMFLSLPESAVIAVDAETGEEIWRVTPSIDGDLSICCGRVNRGLAVLNDFVYVATLDNRLIAIESASGKVAWDERYADPADAYSSTVAPLAVGDKIIVGVSGGEYGIRGFLAAFDGQTGNLEWKFNTIPGPGENGNETWELDSWKTGGGPTWVTGSYDPYLNLLYWGVGNPSPDFDGSAREGDNLYSNSVVAIDPDNGTLKWHFQFTPHDLHDFDSNQIPVLADREIAGEPRKFMYWANRNGFFYVLDRTNGQYVGSTPFAKQTWALSIDATGRPVKSPDAVPSQQGTLVWPGASGATNWPPPSYHPETGLFYVIRLNRPSVFFSKGAADEREAGDMWLGSASTFVPRSSELSVVAIDPEKLEVVWEKPLPNSDGKGRFSGLLTTKDLLFVGQGKTLLGLDVTSGETLWSSRLGAEVTSPPITYESSGKQFLVVSAGKDVFAFSVGKLD